MFGEEIAVRAKLVRLQGMSSHADRDGLIEWITSVNPKPQHVFVVHGDIDVVPKFVDTLKELGISAHAPDYTEEYDLLRGMVIKTGIAPARKKTAQPKESAAYQKLISIGQELIEVIKENRGGTNKDLKKFAEQINDLVEKWKR